MLEQIQRKIHRIKKDEKGMTVIEMVLGVLIFVMLLAFMLDILLLFWKFSVVSQTTTHIARVAGIQGGVLDKAPNQWPYNGGYLDKETLDITMKSKMDSANIDRWRIQIGDRGLLGTEGLNESRRYDYKDVFEVVTTIEYKWENISKFVPGFDFEQTITAKRPAMSEWKYNYNSWVGE